MPKIEVAVRSEMLCKAIEMQAGKEYTVRSCHDGNQALYLYDEMKPDFLILDMELPEKDGLSVLSAIRASGHDVTILILTVCTQTEYLQHMASRFNISGIFFKPCTAVAILKSVYEIYAYNSGKPIELEYGIRMLLMDMKLDQAEINYWYMVEAIKLYHKDPTCQITKVVYPLVGKMYNIADAQIERGIRKIIKSAWENRDEVLWKMYFSTKDITKSPPSNKKFILAMAMRLKNMKIG